MVATVVEPAEGRTKDQVAVIDVTGMIVNSRVPGLLSDGENPVSVFHEQLRHAAKSKYVKAIVLRLNTPGGAVAASDMMYREMLDFKKQTGKPVVVVMMDVAASGGYYIACAGDYLIAYPSTVTASIGVIFQTLSLKPALSSIGIQAEAITSGPNKDAGSPLSELTDGHRAVYREMVDTFYADFTGIVRAARPGITDSDFEEVTDGRVVTGRRAFEVGLVDALGGLDDGFAKAKALAGIRDASLIRYDRPLNYVGSPYASTDGPVAGTRGTQVNLLQLNLDGKLGGLGPSCFYYTLDIECPSCGEMLELDAGFAGGVCRCSNCGTLMTVPSDAGKAESLIKPSSSASVGSGGMSSMGVPDPKAERSRGSKSKRGGSKKNRSGDKGRTSSTIEAGEYRTASGKVVRVDQTTRVPMAEGKRKKVRAATATVFFSIVALLVVGAVIGIIAIMGGPGDPGGANNAASFDPAANPYTLDIANVMGVPVSDRTVVVIEASMYSAEWSQIVGDLLGEGLSHEAKGAQVALIGAGDSPVLFAGGAPSEVPFKAGEVSAWLKKMPTTGEGDVAAAIKKALEWAPKTLILIHGYTELSSIEAWDALVKDQEGLKIHTVHIGDNSPELEGWANEYGGEGAVWSIAEIEALKELAAETEDE
eukprot:g14209.t1